VNFKSRGQNGGGGEIVHVKVLHIRRGAWNNSNSNRRQRFKGTVLKNPKRKNKCLGIDTLGAEREEREESVRTIARGANKTPSLSHGSRQGNPGREKRMGPITFMVRK